MSSISSEEIISILKSEIENFDYDTSDKETGSVIWVGDGIATVYGIDHAMYGEIVVFDTGVKGMVQDIRKTGQINFHVSRVRFDRMVSKTAKGNHFPVLF